MFVLLKRVFDYLFAPIPPAKSTWQHPTLGTFHYIDDGWWETQYVSNGEQIELNVVGTNDEPDVQEMAVLVQNMDRLAQLRQTVFEFMRDQPLAPDENRLRISGIMHLWDDHQEHFFVTLDDSVDEARAWRVEFFGSVPKYLTCDS